MDKSQMVHTFLFKKVLQCLGCVSDSCPACIVSLFQVGEPELLTAFLQEGSLVSQDVPTLSVN